MRPKRHKTSAIEVHETLDNDNYDNNSPTRSEIIVSASNSNKNGSNRLTTNDNSFTSSTNVINSASSSNDSNLASLFTNKDSTSPSLPTNITGRRSSSDVWQYAIKSDDGKMAKCQLCDYICTAASHSTSTIRYHLIREHNKYDLIIKPSATSSAKPRISEHLKQELHSLCYNSIIIDQRPFTDFQKDGMLAIFNKLCPGKIDFASISCLKLYLGR